MERPETTCRPIARLAWVVGAWGLLIAAGPGALTSDGLPFLAAVALGMWSHAASRPGRFALAIEWLAASLGLGATMFWIAFVFNVALPPAAIGMGLYMALAGVALRRLAQRLPLVLAAPIAWVAFETLRDLAEPPIGMGWLRVGHLASAHPWWLGGARMIGVEGLSFTIVALGAGLAAAAGARSVRPLVAGFGPLLLAVLLGVLTAPGEMRPGPRLLLVQPNLSVYEKQGKLSWNERYRRQVELTAEGIAAAGGAIDAVLWPETTAPVALLGDGVPAAIESGVGFAPWLDGAPEPTVLLTQPRDERYYVHGELLDLVPEGAAFLSGAEEWVAHGGILRRRNVLALWQRDPGGEVRREVGAKRKLAPGGETMLGLERVKVVRDWIFQMANYLPDFLAAERSEVLRLAVPGGDDLRIGATVCFDNAYQGPYLDTVRREPVDLFAMVSNEAWYHGSWELDQMVAFSRTLAVMTGRALVRCTNSGITTVLDPSGRRIATLLVDGVDRQVQGSLAVRVPVPAGDRPPPPYARWVALLRWPGVLLALLAAFSAGRARTPGSLGDRSGSPG